MGVKNSVFASKAERNNYLKLSRNWGDNYRIHHNLPFLNIFTPTNLNDLYFLNSEEELKLSRSEINLLKKTSVDYTLCNLDDTPILCIEFDGLQEGFNIGTTYKPISISPVSNISRKKITELKLVVAHGSSFPFFILNSKHFDEISKDTKLMIVDGIIGEVLSQIETEKIVSMGFNPSDINMEEDEFNSLPSSIQHEMIQNWLWNIELEMEYTYNPISIEVSKRSQKLNISSTTLERMEYPTPQKGLSINERIEEFRNVISFGSKVTIRSDEYGEAVGKVWLPNFNTPRYSGFGLLDEIAELFALENMRRNNKIS